jgi:hypothetical protein
MSRHTAILILPLERTRRFVSQVIAKCWIGPGLNLASPSIELLHCHEDNAVASIRVKSIKILADHEVLIRFSDGEERRVDLTPLMRGTVFREIREDPVRFAEVKVDQELGTIVWPNGADLDPDVFYGFASPAWEEESQTSD